MIVQRPTRKQLKDFGNILKRMYEKERARTNECISFERWLIREVNFLQYLHVKHSKADLYGGKNESKNIQAHNKMSLMRYSL